MWEEGLLRSLQTSKHSIHVAYIIQFRTWTSIWLKLLDRQPVSANYCTLYFHLKLQYHYLLLMKSLIFPSYYFWKLIKLNKNGVWLKQYLLTELSRVTVQPEKNAHARTSLRVCQQATSCSYTVHACGSLKVNRLWSPIFSCPARPNCLSWSVHSGLDKAPTSSEFLPSLHSHCTCSYNVRTSAHHDFSFSFSLCCKPDWTLLTCMLPILWLCYTAVLIIASNYEIFSCLL